MSSCLKLSPFLRTCCIMPSLNSQCTCYFLKTYLARLLETNLGNQFRSRKLNPNYFQFIRPIGQNLRRMTIFLRRMKVNIFGYIYRYTYCPINQHVSYSGR